MRSRSEEVMVDVWLNFEEVISRNAYIHCFAPDKHSTLRDDEWVLNHLQDWSSEEFYERLEIKEPGVYQILMKVTLRGFYSGWEIAEYDEELDIEEFDIKKYPDNWFDGDFLYKDEELKLDVKEEP